MAPSLFSLCTTSCSLMMFRCCISLRSGLEARPFPSTASAHASDFGGEEWKEACFMVEKEGLLILCQRRSSAGLVANGSGTLGRQRAERTSAGGGRRSPALGGGGGGGISGMGLGGEWSRSGVGFHWRLIDGLGGGMQGSDRGEDELGEEEGGRQRPCRRRLRRGDAGRRSSTTGLEVRRVDGLSGIGCPRGDARGGGW